MPEKLENNSKDPQKDHLQRIQDLKDKHNEIVSRRLKRDEDHKKLLDNRISSIQAKPEDFVSKRIQQLDNALAKYSGRVRRQAQPGNITMQEHLENLKSEITLEPNTVVQKELAHLTVQKNEIELRLQREREV